MAARRRRSTARIYWRMQGGARRAYGDFRDYGDAGGGREALAPRGEKLATVDEATAQLLVAERLKELEAVRRGRNVHGITKAATLATFAREHLIAKKRSNAVTDQWLEAAEKHLERAISYFGEDKDVAAISTADVRAWATALQQMSNGRGGTMSGGNIRHHINTLSNLYRRAQAEGYVLPGYNPVAALMEKPSGRREEARWLEIPEAAFLLDTARRYEPAREDIAIPFACQIIGTMLLTGGRMSEVLGLELRDISFERRTVTFRPNQWRRLKTATSHRTIPIWPQLEEILAPYMFGEHGPQGLLLFPSQRTGNETMLTDIRKLLDQVGKRGGWKVGEIRSKMFRHTYTAARLQTLDNGAPVSLFTVAKELGHGGEAMVRKVYGHLGQVRHRSEFVEYRPEMFKEKLQEKLSSRAG